MRLSPSSGWITGVAGIERGLGIGDGGELLVVDRDQFAGVLGLGAGARHHGADRLALPAGAVDRDGVLRRRLDALEMREHADPGRDHLGKLRAGDHGDDAGRRLRRRGIDRLDARMRVRRAHERHMRHARQRHVADELRAALRQPRQVRPRHRAADIGVRPVERGEGGRVVVGDFHRARSRPLLRHRLDRIDDRLIAGAAAVVAGDVLADFLAARHAAVAQQLLRGQQHAGRAEAALQRVALLERGLQVGDLAGIRHALDGLDLARRRIAPPASGSRARPRRRPAPCRRRRRRARSRHGCRSAPASRAGNRPASCAPRPVSRTSSPFTVTAMSWKRSLMAWLR